PPAATSTSRKRRIERLPSSFATMSCISAAPAISALTPSSTNGASPLLRATKYPAVVVDTGGTARIQPPSITSSACASSGNRPSTSSPALKQRFRITHHLLDIAIRRIQLAHPALLVEQVDKVTVREQHRITVLVLILHEHNTKFFRRRANLVGAAGQPYNLRIKERQVLLELLGRITLRIKRNEHHCCLVAITVGAQRLPRLGDARQRRRADIRAIGVAEEQQHHLAVQRGGVEGLAVLVGQGDRPPHARVDR